MLVVVARSIILYIVILVVMRIMGKRQLGQLQPFELVITILISELAAVPMQNTGIPLINGIVPILILMIAQISLSYITLKSEKARGIICGKPDILVQNGQIMEDKLKKLHINVNDLFEQLRVKGYADIKDVEFAIVETEGQMSVIPKSTKRPATPEDLNIQVKPVSLPITLIIDGTIIYENFKIANMNLEGLKKKLKQSNIEDHRQVLFAGLDSSAKFFVQPKKKTLKRVKS